MHVYTSYIMELVTFNDDFSNQEDQYSMKRLWWFRVNIIRLYVNKREKKPWEKVKKKRDELNGTYDKLCLCKFYGIHLIIWIPYD